MSRELVLTDRGPVYRQIVEYFREQIISGDMDSGTQLPTERALAAQLGVNRSTVSTAYDELRAMGLIRSVPGRGTRVSEDSWGQAYRTPDWATYLEQGIFQPTLPLVRRIWMANRQPGFINFARGEMASELWPYDNMLTVLQKVSSQLPLGYSDPRGEEVLRSAIANHLRKEYHLEVSDHRVLVTAGSQQGLLLVIQTLLRPGDAVGLEQPSYAYSLPLFAAAGIRRFPLPMDDDGLIPEAIIPLHQRYKIRMVFVTPTYQNPTGTTLTVSRRQRLLDICGALRIPIIEDDAHGPLTMVGSAVPPPPVAVLSDANHQVLYLGTLSKTWAPGLRIGWLVGPKSVVDRLAGVREQMDFGVSTLAQVAAAEILQSGAWNQQLAHLQSTLTRRRNAMANALIAAFGNTLQFTLPEGGYQCGLPCIPERRIPSYLMRHWINALLWFLGRSMALHRDSCVLLMRAPWNPKSPKECRDCMRPLLGDPTWRRPRLLPQRADNSQEATPMVSDGDQKVRGHYGIVSCNEDIHDYSRHGCHTTVIYIVYLIKEVNYDLLPYRGHVLVTAVNPLVVDRQNICGFPRTIPANHLEHSCTDCWSRSLWRRTVRSRQVPVR